MSGAVIHLLHMLAAPWRALFLIKSSFTFLKRIWGKGNLSRVVSGQFAFVWTSHTEAASLAPSPAPAPPELPDCDSQGAASLLGGTNTAGEATSALSTPFLNSLLTTHKAAVGMRNSMKKAV